MRRGNYENRQIKLGDQIYYGGGHLHVTDDKGSYSIPVGRKARRELCVLREVPGKFKHSIEIDLITGKVYLNVDHQDDAANVYYYDMASEKLWNQRLLRLLRTAARSGMVLEDNLRKVVVKLPSSDWKEMLLTLPGWEETIDHRLDNLLLPQGEVEVVRCPAQAQLMASEQAQSAKPEQAQSAENAIASVHLPDSNFALQKKDGLWELHYADQTAGGEFFGSTVEYLRNLTPAEYCWVIYVLQNKDEEEARELLVRFLRREIEVEL